MRNQESTFEGADGAWLYPFKQSTWERVLDLSVEQGEQTVEVSRESCAEQSNGDVFCLLRSIDITQDTIAYLGAYIPKIESHQIYAIVARTEGLNGTTIGRDLYKVTSINEIGSPKQMSILIERVRELSVVNRGRPAPGYINILTQRL
jgi:hypothetical protein